MRGLMQGDHLLISSLIEFVSKGEFMKAKFIQKQLRRIKLEFQELIGVMSIGELITNSRFINRYKKLHHELVKVY